MRGKVGAWKCNSSDRNSFSPPDPHEADPSKVSPTQNRNPGGDAGILWSLRNAFKNDKEISQRANYWEKRGKIRNPFKVTHILWVCPEFFFSCVAPFQEFQARSSRQADKIVAELFVETFPILELQKCYLIRIKPYWKRKNKNVMLQNICM